MRLVIVTGMSGSGKQTAMKLLEDAGYYCVDNLPVPLVPTFAELIVQPGSEIEKAAVGLDIRSDQAFGDIMKALSQLTERGIAYEVLFMDADDSTLLKRYKESRRMHPIDGNGAIEESILKERSILKEIRDKADYVIDTSSLLTRELKEELDRIFVRNEAYNSLMITIMSFGFKNGIPLDADLVFDVRFLPNPYYIEELRPMSGNDQPVRDYVMNNDTAKQFLTKLTDMVEFLIPNYISEGKTQLVIGIGCTGGKHRSVTLANELYEALKKTDSYGVRIEHRDIGKDAITKAK